MTVLLPANHHIATTIDTYLGARKTQWICISEAVVWYRQQRDGFYSDNVLNMMDLHDHTKGEADEGRFLAKLLEGPPPLNSEDRNSYDFKVSEMGKAITFLLHCPAIAVDQLVELFEKNGGRAGLARMQRAKDRWPVQNAVSLSGNVASLPGNDSVVSAVPAAPGFRQLTGEKEPFIGIQSTAQGWEIEISYEGGTISTKTNGQSDTLTITVI